VLKYSVLLPSDDSVKVGIFFVHDECFVFVVDLLIQFLEKIPVVRGRERLVVLGRWENEGRLCALFVLPIDALEVEAKRVGLRGPINVGARAQLQGDVAPVPRAHARLFTLVGPQLAQVQGEAQRRALHLAQGPGAVGLEHQIDGVVFDCHADALVGLLSVVVEVLARDALNREWGEYQICWIVLH